MKPEGEYNGKVLQRQPFPSHFEQGSETSTVFWASWLAKLRRLLCHIVIPYWAKFHAAHTMKMPGLYRLASDPRSFLLAKVSCAR